MLEAAQLLLKLGADVNAVDANGETAMHGAAYKNLPKVVQFLADNGAKIEVWNRKNKYGWTPLVDRGGPPARELQAVGRNHHRAATRDAAGCQPSRERRAGCSSEVVDGWRWSEDPRRSSVQTAASTFRELEFTEAMRKRAARL